MQGIILMNAYTKFAGAMRQSQRIADELLKLGVKTKIIKNGGVDAVISNGEILLKEKPDFVVYLDKDKYLSRMFDCCDISPDEFIENLEKVTKEDIVNAATNVVLDTVYILKPTEEVQ